MRETLGAFRLPPTRRTSIGQEPNDVRVVLNGNQYWAKGDPAATYPPDPSPTADPYGHDWTLDGDPTTAGQPVVRNRATPSSWTSRRTDVDAPPLWGLIPLSPSPKTHAKVEIFQAQSEVGMLPFAVPDLNPKTVAALWVDQTKTNAVDSWTFLTGPANPSTTVLRNGKSVALWRAPTELPSQLSTRPE